LYNWKFILVIAALILGIFASANLRKPSKGVSNEKRAGIDVMIALDVSKSMLSEDVKPSRLEKAKQCVNLLIDKLSEDRVGLVVFAGRAYLQMPLTPDAAASKIFVSNASPAAVQLQGTVVADALRLSDRSLDIKEKKFKAIVLISDGEDHDASVEDAIKELYDHGVVVYTIGIGTPEGAPIKEPGTNSFKTDINGQTIITKLNEAGLRNIAQSTGGVYYHLDNSANTATAIAKDLDGLDKKAFDAFSGARNYSSFFPFFIALSIILLVIEIFIPETKRVNN
jgi:Ca-activated chloride channel family protein